MMTLAEAVESVRHGGRSVKVRCPAHADNAASLNVSPGDDQPVILHCHADCDTADVIAASGLDWAEVCKPLDTPVAPSNLVRFPEPVVYTYTDENGNELFQAVRTINRSTGKKDFHQRHPNADGKWVNGLGDARRVLYRLPKVIETKARGGVIVVVEGEKDVHTIEERFPGVTATTSPMGAGRGKWLDTYTQTLAGATVYVIADKDDPGWAHARYVQQELSAAGCTVRVWESPRGGKGFDLTDHVQAGGTLEDLTDITARQIDVDEAVLHGIDVLDFVAQQMPPEEFVIEGTLAREERGILTGWEGKGKSTLLIQMAVLTAMGVHPFTHARMEPQRVLVFDAENNTRQLFKAYSRMVNLGRRCGYTLDRDMLTLMPEYRNQPDLTNDGDLAILLDHVKRYQPDLIVIGPLYYLTSREIKDDSPAKALCRAIDAARDVYGSAILIEGHSPHRQAGEKERDLRPYGSSRFVKWPEYCFGLRPIPDSDDSEYDLVPTRGLRDADHVWPERLRRGTKGSMEWPWVECAPASDNVRSIR